jgi:hypothetical protein
MIMIRAASDPAAVDVIVPPAVAAANSDWSELMLPAMSFCSKPFDVELTPAFSSAAMSLFLSCVNGCSSCKPFVTESSATVSFSVI